MARRIHYKMVNRFCWFEASFADCWPNQTSWIFSCSMCNFTNNFQKNFFFIMHACVNNAGFHWDSHIYRTAQLQGTIRMHLDASGRPCTRHVSTSAKPRDKAAARLTQLPHPFTRCGTGHVLNVCRMRANVTLELSCTVHIWMDLTAYVFGEQNNAYTSFVKVVVRTLIT